MNTTIRITAAAALCIAAAAQAQQEAGAVPAIDFHGEDSGSFGLSQVRPAAPVRRADVGAQLAEARRSGDVPGLHGEDSGSFLLARREAMAAGELRDLGTTRVAKRPSP